MAITLIKYKQLDLVGKIVNADIGAAAAIATSKLADGSVFAKTNVTNTFTADQNLGSKKITNLADGTVATDAINKGQLDGVDNNLQGQINNINSALLDGLKTPLPFDASANATFPNHTKGTTLKVTVGGTTDGVILEVGDTIIYDATGTSPYVVQANIDKATEAIAGTIRIATNLEVTAGTNDTAAVVPLYLQNKLNALTSSINTTQEGKFVRFDINNQGLNATQQGNARTNIAAAADSEVVKLSGAQTIADVKTFTSSPIIPDGQTQYAAINKGQLDAAVLASGMDNLVINETPSGALNGSNVTFTLAHTPINGKEISPTLNGQTIYKTNDYTISGDTITMVVAPEASDVLKVTYIKT